MLAKDLSMKTMKQVLFQQKHVAIHLFAYKSLRSFYTFEQSETQPKKT